LPEPWRIFETAKFRSALERIQPPGLRERMAVRLRDHVYPQLALQPRFGPNIKKLADFKPDTWCYRLGRWRVFYTVEDLQHTVALLTVVQRRDAY
jgi:mRNA interferase RelE/StbE